MHLYPTALVSKCPAFFFSSYEAAAAIGNPVVPISIPGLRLFISKWSMV